MNLLRLFLALALWPGVWATGISLNRLIQAAASSPTFPWWTAACFGGGWLVAGLAYLLLPRPRGFYVLGHELSHALAVWFSGGKVHSLQVADKGGRVVSNRTSAWITLAPYILPLYPLVAAILWLAALQIWPVLAGYQLAFLGIWGGVWGYHYAFTVDLLRTQQPDFLVYGRIFSLTVIALTNLLLAIGMVWSFFQPVTLATLMMDLGRDWVWTYMEGVHWLSGLLLRYLPPPPKSLPSVLISELIQEKNIIACLEAEDRPQAYRKMLEHLADKGFIPKDLLDSSEKALQVREEKMTTAMGGGFAIPHASIAKLKQLATLFARCPTGVDCQAMDGKPVKLFFLILVPADQAQVHLQTLATVAKFFNRRGIKNKILEAKEPAEILQLFQAS